MGEVRKALVAAGFEDSEIHLELTQTGNVGGFVVSKKFEGHTQVAHQETLWAELDQPLLPERLQRIVSIFTMTPDEVENDLRVSNG